MNSKKNNNSLSRFNIYLPFCLIILLLVVIIGGSYAIFQWTSANGNRSSNSVSTATIKCNFNEGNPIILSSAQPLSDNVGMNLGETYIDGYADGYFDSTIQCSCTGNCSGKYELYAIKSNEENSIDEKYIKVYLTDGAVGGENVLNDVSRYSDLDTSSINSKGKKLYTTSFAGSFNNKHRLRVWLSNDYPVTTDSLEFKLKLYVKVLG